MTDGVKPEPNLGSTAQQSSAAFPESVDLTKDAIVRVGAVDSKIQLAIERGKQSFVCADEGLHMRPSSQIVILANTLSASGLQLELGAPTVGIDDVDTQSMMSIMMKLGEASLNKQPIEVRITAREGAEQQGQEAFKDAWTKVFNFDFWEPVDF